ncbi:MAG TPA: nitroreductase [Flavobacteriales bacterium]|nr:nitroreductase [Flavobacteriales bacterium]
MNLDNCLAARRSVRGFLPDKSVPVEVLEDIFSRAQAAPSNCNVQPWRVFVAWHEQCHLLRTNLLAAFDGGDFGSPEDAVDAFVGDYRTLQIECAQALYSEMGIARGDKAGRLRAHRRNFEFFEAPHVLIVCMDKNFGLGVALDVGMYIQTLMLLLKSRDIDSCAQASLRMYPDIVRQTLDIDDNLRIMCAISFGYEDKGIAANKTQQRRRPWQDNVVWQQP